MHSKFTHFSLEVYIFHPNYLGIKTGVPMAGTIPILLLGRLLTQGKNMIGGWSMVQEFMDNLSHA